MNNAIFMGFLFFWLMYMAMFLKIVHLDSQIRRILDEMERKRK